MFVVLFERLKCRQILDKRTGVTKVVRFKYRECSVHDGAVVESSKSSYFQGSNAEITHVGTGEEIIRKASELYRLVSRLEEDH